MTEGAEAHAEAARAEALEEAATRVYGAVIDHCAARGHWPEAHAIAFCVSNEIRALKNKPGTDAWHIYDAVKDWKARAEAAEKRALELALALDAALTGWHDAPPTYQDDYDSIAELRAVLEAKP